MPNKVAAFAATPDPTMSGQTPPAAEPHKGQKATAAPAVPDQADLRLVIEEDQASGSYVYKTINRRTGEVVLQLPRDEVLRLREETGYAAGAVIRTKA